MADTSWFLTTRPAYPWSVYPIGLPALGVVAAALAAITVWTYLGHHQATRKRLLIILALRMLALVVALLTALRPSVGVQEEPKVPTTLIISVDDSETMTVKDEVNNQRRIDAVRKTLDKCKPILDELENDLQVKVVMYRFSTPDFNPETSLYDPNSPCDGKRSDYGTYLNRTFEKWQGERFVRGHLIIGDGADNGLAFPALGQAARWGQRGVPLTTFVVGSENSDPSAKDLSVTAITADPSPAPIKSKLTVVARVNSYGFTNPKVKARVLFDDKVVAVEDVTLSKERDNEIRIPVEAPATPGEVKVRVEVGQEVVKKVNGKDETVIEPLAGELSPLNNFSETYLTITKEGVRVLVIDRLRPENARILDALRGEKRFDLYFVNRQTELPPTPDELQWLDLEAQACDVVIIGNVSASQLLSADARLLQKITDRVVKKGMGLMFLGGEAAFAGLPAPPDGDPLKRDLAFGDLIPVVPNPGAIIERVDQATRLPQGRYQTVPTAEGLQRYVMRVGSDPAQSRQLWDDLNALRGRSRLTGLSDFRAKPGNTILAWATADGPPASSGPMPANAHPLLVSQQLGEGKSGRILAFAGYDSYLWETLGQPKTRQGMEIHNRFWKQCVLWLAHQEEEEGQVYARPEFRRLPVGADQVIRVGFKSPSGGDDPNAELHVKILPQGQDSLADEERAPLQQVLRDKTGAKVLFKPPTPGEYTVVVTSPVKDKDGKPVNGPDGKPLKHRGTARFIAYPEVSDEMLRVAASPDFMSKLSAQTGGKALRLEDLPTFLKELKTQPMDVLKPKPKYYPDWRRNHSKGFLTAWFVLFVVLVGTEWGLRRLWGLV